MRRQRSKQELRCFCSRKPLLAVWGNEANGRPYVHVKIYKQGRVFGETVHYDGEVKIRCRECFRWHSITFVGETHAAQIEETETPTVIDQQTGQAYESEDIVLNIERGPTQ